jgi:hypothetical protein
MRPVYRDIEISAEGGFDKGKTDNGTEYNYKWNKKQASGLQELYTSLRDMNAFIIPYKSETGVMDRGGDCVTYRINGLDYLVSNENSNFIADKDQVLYKKSTAAINRYALKFRAKGVQTKSKTAVNKN